MDEQQDLEATMGLIMYGGNAKSGVMGTIATAKSGGSKLTDKETADAEESLVHVHHSQTEVLTEGAKGNNMQVMLLAAHSQDHLMTAIAFADLVKEIIDLYRRTDNEQSRCQCVL